MKTHKVIRIIGFLLMTWVLSLNLPAAAKKDPWKEWLREVEPIMSRLERSIATSLEKEEERSRFQELFWKARDPNPQTPVNEFQVEFQRRVYYAKKYLNGVNSDRGRIYILLGEPQDKSSFIGYDALVESELWSYQGLDRPGLFPYMNIVFFRPRNTGDFQLYYPGVHQPKDLLSPQYANTTRSQVLAYREIKTSSAELAGASLSIIPSEGDPSFGATIGSSNMALNQIYSLPDREAEAGYVNSFRTPTGNVEVTHSTNVIRGFGSMTAAPAKGISFIHYALMPDVLHFKQPTPELYTAEIQLNISIEDIKGNILYQNQKDIDLKFDPAKKKQIDDQRMVFRDFVPIIPGEFEVSVTFINKTTQEFFTHEERIRIPGEKSQPTVSGAVGFKLSEIKTDRYIPFAADNYLVSVDPRNIFSQKDTLEGMVFTSGTGGTGGTVGNPGIFLESLNDETVRVTIRPQSVPLLPASDNPIGPGIFTFRQSLKEVKDGNYRLKVKPPAGEPVILVEKIHVLPFYIEVKRPFAIEKTEAEAARNNYIFVQGQEYLNSGSPDQAIACFNHIPRALWNAASLPIIANAYYKKEDYAAVLELLGKEEVKKEYPVLLMLANSAIHLKLYPRALEYLEKIRKYGDTVEIDQLIAATYLNLGNREKATVYYEQARKLKNKSPEPGKEDKDKENKHD